MTDWEYRVAKFQDGQQVVYTIVEAFYDINENIVAITGEPFFPAAMTMPDLAQDLKGMAEALGKPIIDAGEVQVSMQTHESYQ